MHRTRRTGTAGERGKDREGERKRKTELAIRAPRHAARPLYLGGGLIRGQEAVLRLVQLLQHPVPLVLRRPQQLLLRRDVLLELGGSGGRARVAGTDRVLDTHTQHTGTWLAGAPGLGRRRLGVQGALGNLFSPEAGTARWPTLHPHLPRDESPAEVSAGSSRQVGCRKTPLRPWPSGRTLYSVPSLFPRKNFMTPPTPAPRPVSIPVEAFILSSQKSRIMSNTFWTRFPAPPPNPTVIPNPENQVPLGLELTSRALESRGGK